MKAVALFISNEELDNIPQCAKDISEELSLSRSKSKKKEYPVWIEELHINNKYYYMIFIALDHGKLYSYNVNSNRTKLKSVDCLSGMKDITNSKRGIGSLYAAIKKTSNNNSNNTYTSNVSNFLNKIKELSPSAKSWSPKSKSKSPQKGGYIKVQGGGTRKVRHYKNGNPYVLLNGRKVKL